MIFDAPPDLVSKLNNYFLITEMIMRHVVLTFNGDLEKFVTVASQRSQGETSAEEDSATRQSARDSETSNEDGDEGTGVLSCLSSFLLNLSLDESITSTILQYITQIFSINGYGKTGIECDV